MQPDFPPGCERRQAKLQHLSPVSGLILAGGASRRMGRDKAFLELGGRALIELVIVQMATVCAEVLIVAGDVRPYLGLGLPTVQDRFQGAGVLGGLHAGLEAASYELTIAVGCDMPFLNPALLEALIRWSEGFDVVLLRRGTEVEPLHATYRRTCLQPIEEAIQAGERRIISFFDRVRVRYLTPEEVRPLDPELRSFFNVNTPEEWQIAQRWYSTTDAPPPPAPCPA
ncbi:MAG: molybdenum cofactor guanylyltransferase [Anaerolineae bacterium]|nr:molybdenum cofactor guanylyltransferase [Anaerolineae bacterium]